MANITFKNSLNRTIYINMRIGPINVPPNERGEKNDVIKPGELVDVPVGDGDAWFCYGNQLISSVENPPLCNAPGGSKVLLVNTLPCYIDN
ncbi:hypothetical protein [Achromobacter animicus]|uniref:hypothetical protein n=1 Tax=Achromobacter animicus TaxID=1389935 RepID=UPI00345E415C